jgi:RNA-binding protein 39
VLLHYTLHRTATNLSLLSFSPFSPSPSPHPLISSPLLLFPLVRVLCDCYGLLAQEEQEEERDRRRSRDDDGKRKHHRRHSHMRSHSGSLSPHKRSRSKDRSHRHSRGSHRRRSRSGSRERRRRSQSHSKERRRGSRSHSREKGRGGHRRYHKKSPSPTGKSPSSRPITLGPPAKRPSPNAEPPSVERDRRTVMCMQLSAKVSPHDLEEFFQKVGQVCDVKMISDRNSRRSKGIAYVEFYDENSVLPVSWSLVLYAVCTKYGRLSFPRLCH